ncbi:hypothetical protein A1O3_05897 [Capronia epimyces CBS 606.96]|uniref:NACHT domain-containing protein n=1 Tax=Capronia epimyces CBS 606.96 TaxID=1182542 RepID=W9XXD7_9EURO|nr:uncharacterized protein A1O3_05897 [Capronia epimyces CBS 606.96]EXJ85222.1 hypothetical protein A1O3_05897 [Capronia epimyces CBS 606.96]
MSMSTPTSGLEKAIAEYTRRFGQPANYNPNDDLRQAIEAANIDFQKWRQSHESFWNALEACVAPIVLIGGFAQEATGVFAAPASIALGGAISLIQVTFACEKVSQTYDSVEDMFKKLEESLSRWESYTDSRAEVPDRLVKLAPVVASLIIAIIARARILVEEGKMGKFPSRYIRNLVKGGDKETSKLFQDLDDVILFQDHAVADSTFSRLNQSWGKILDVERRLEEILEHQRKEDDRLRLNSFRTESYKQVHEAYQRRVTEMVDSTGSWMQDERVYRDWLAHHQPLLIILGGPGTGKSFLAASTIKLIKEKASADVSVAFFFVKGQDEKSQNIKEILKTVAFDLQQSKPSFRSHLLDAIDDDDRWNADQTWTSLFEGFWKNDLPNGRLVLIIDGLDEASEEQQRILGDILRRSSTSTAMQFGVFGRFTLRTTLRLQQITACIDISAALVRDEFAQYVQREMDLAECVKFASKEKRDGWVDKIITKTQGIFESARQVTVNIQPMEGYAIDLFLEKPLNSLEKITECSLDIIRKEQALEPDVLRALLTWLAYSRRPLNLGEVYEILRAQDGHEHELLLKNLRFKLRPIVECIMFSVDSSNNGSGKISEKTEEKAPDQWTEAELMLTTVSLSHEGIRDYLKGQTASGAGYTHEPESAQVAIVKSCFQMLKQTRSSKLQVDTPRRFLFPMMFLITHLKALNLSSLASEDVRKINDGLAWLLWDDAGKEAFLTAIAVHCTAVCDTLFFDQDVTTTLQESISISPTTSVLRRDESAGFGVISSALQSYYMSVLAFLSWVWLLPLRISFPGINVQGISDKQPQSKPERSSLGKDEWLRKARRSMIHLFEPLRLTAARGWLLSDPISTSGDDARIAAQKLISCVWTLIVLGDMDEQGKFDPDCKASLLHNKSTDGLESHEIQALARRQHLEQTADWFLNLGFTLQRFGHYHEAVEEYQKVLKEDEHCFCAVWRLAQCYTKLGDYNKTHQWTEKLRQIRPGSSPHLEDLSIRLMRLKGDDEGVVEHLRKAYSKDNSNAEKLLDYLRSLDRSGNHMRMIEVLLELAGRDVPSKPYTRLAQLLGNVELAWSWVSKSFASQKGTPDVALLLDAITSSRINIEPTYLQIPWERRFNWFQYAHVNKHLEDAIQIHETLLQRAGTIASKHANGEEDQFIYQSSLIGDLAQLYFEQLTRPEGSSSNMSSAAERLDKLAQQSRSMEDLPLNKYPTGTLLYPWFLYGRYLRQTHPDDESKWKPIFRPYLTRYVPLLETTTVADIGLKILSVTNMLFHAGDDERAVALSILLLKAHHQSSPDHDIGRASQPVRSRSPARLNDVIQWLAPSRKFLSAPMPSPSSPPAAGQLDPNTRSHSKSHTFDSPFLNCGVCSRFGREIDEYFICVICSDASFCGRCKDQRRYLYGATCPESHGKVRIWPIDPTLEDVAVEEGEDGRLRLRQTWLTDLKAEWEI